ncbi:chitinase [Rheinheimera sp. YQF-2]|uniref:chitinase n=1 Tax=Rheinheimera lutimaris TaxID=2740584 RepID=A0A7Y5APK7_9GAMM|nr:glycosyl hydrolase family 18 protein [Rheinheimera lutimaris]NRQ41735.1 chitinase [Rheinheimera lutimaris]
MFKQTVKIYSGISLLLLAASVQAATPNAPVISWMPADYQLQNGSVQVPIRWDMWWGTNGNKWYLQKNDSVVYDAILTPNGQNAQTGNTSLTFTQPGSYQLQVSLCQVNGATEECAQSGITTINISGAGGGDGGDGGDGSFDPWTDLDMTAWPHPLKQNNVAYNNSTGKKVGAYFVEWGIYGRAFNPADIPAQNLTHIYYGFIPLCGPNEGLRQANPEGYAALNSQCAGKPDYSVVVHDKFAALEKGYPGDVWDQPIRGIFAELYRLKQAHPHIKILPSVGGWTLSDPLYQVGVNPAARAVFIDSIIDFIRTYDFFDGIDIDWEFPGGGGATPELGSPQDGAGFATLMQELRAALDALEVETGREYELAAAMSGGVEKLSVVDWEDAAPYMDYINLMTYDYYGAWNGVLGHQTGLYPSPNSPISGFSAHEAVQYLLNRGVPAGKIALGAAMYGRGWQNVSGTSGGNPFTGTGGDGITGGWERGIMDYKKIEADFMGGPDASGVNGFTVGWDDTAKASYVWNPATNTLISIDTKRSVREKGAYILQHQLGGIFAWEIDADNGHILNAMHEGLGHTQQ